ncbi:MAG: serine/threonine protein kinase, partial [Myxococcales bacterium]|nr:serine/threonine protein kinase [Myxococcales bacterium]
KSYDRSINRSVAVKAILSDEADPAEYAEALSRFRREAQAAGRLHHPNIVSIFEYGQDGGLAYIAMEFVKGRSLRDVLNETPKLDPEKALSIMQPMCAAFIHAHNGGVVHRDIKPANIMISDYGDVKVTDFGIARFESSDLTQEGEMLGTPSYMSPEQVLGKPVDRRSDIFSLGSMYYEMLSGQKAFSGSSMTEVIYAILNG